MSENNQPNEQQIAAANDRRRRINKLKKIIIITALILIIIPIIMCVILMFRVSSLQKKLDELLVLRDSGEIVAQHDDNGKVYYVYANTIENDVIGDTQVSVPSVETLDIVLDDQVEPETQPVEQVDTGRYVYLTFDDGPSSQTEKIISILDEYNVKATFFVIGKEDEVSLQRYKMIVESGNSIGIHSYSHTYEEVYASVDSFANDVQKISDLVYNATGVRTKLYRFPGGSSNAIADDISVFIEYLTANGYTYYDWNSSSKDASSVMPPKEEIVNTVISEVEGKDNVVVLMHDSERKESTVEALPELIEKLQAMGYTIKGIDENSVPVQHR